MFAPEAQEHLLSLYRYIAKHASPATAAKYTEAIVAYCERLGSFPQRGLLRDDVRPGLRLTNYRRRTVIAFEVDDANHFVAIIGVFYGGRNYEAFLSAEK